jgi:adenylyltransferase/sulfurtransferase
MPTLRIPTPLRPYAEGQTEVSLQGDTVGAALDDLTNRYPALRQHLFSENGELRAFVNIFLNEEDIRHINGVDTPLGETDKLMLIPSIAGGRPS